MPRGARARLVARAAGLTRALLQLAPGARALALGVHGGALLWADAEGAVRACDKDACAPASARLLRNNTGLLDVFTH